MRISQLSLHGRGAWPDLRCGKLNPHLNVFYAPPRTGKSTLSEMIGHLLYGKTSSQWRRQFGQSVPFTDGSATVISPQGKMILQRHRDKDNAQITTTASQGSNIARETVDLLGGLSPQIASQLFAIDFAETPRVEWLLSQKFANAFTRQSKSTSDLSFAEHKSPADWELKLGLDRKRIEELIRQRDAIASQIEADLSSQRRNNYVIEKDLADVDSQFSDIRKQAEQSQQQLRKVEARLSELSAQLRRASLEASLVGVKPSDAKQFQEKLGLCDGEISRCRQALADLQSRNAQLSTELASHCPDGTADPTSCRHDSRQTLARIENLLGELDAEVAQLAGANPPSLPPRQDTYARFSPVVDLLRQQVYTLCGQMTQQQRNVDRQQLQIESRQVSHAQVSLSERLELLLAQRETLVREFQGSVQDHVPLAQPPVGDFCCCEHHEQFVCQSDQSSDLIKNSRQQQAVQDSYAELERDRVRLLDELSRSRNLISKLEKRWRQLQQERAGLLGSRTITEKQDELKRLEAILQRTLNLRTPAPKQRHARIWRASQTLAQLTDDWLVQIRLQRHPHQTTVLDRTGQSHSLQSLTAAQHDQLYLALTLALCSACAARGNLLPLILDEPFLRLNPAETAIMVGVLTTFAQEGRQLLVFTEDLQARQRFESLGRTVFDLHQLRQVDETPNIAKPTTQTRIVREPRDDRQSPTLRLTPLHKETDSERFYYLDASSSLSDFPVLGSETDAVFGAMELHSVGDLLAADAEVVATWLNRAEVGTQTVKLWQCHMRLLCSIPELTLNDAQLLTANGINSFEKLRDTNADELAKRILAFCETRQGQRILRSVKAPSKKKIARWVEFAQHHRSLEAA